MSKKIATIAYLKELYGKLGHTLSTTKENTYCPTYSEITQSKYYLNSTNNKNNYGLFIGSQYSVDDSMDGKYADNQCVCEIDIMAIIPNGLNLSIIQSGTTNYGASGTVDCMVDYNELITSGTPYNDLPYIKVELKSKQYQKKDDGQEITSSITNTELSANDSAIKYSGNAITGLTDNKSVSSHTYSLSATCKGFGSSIKFKQLGETYGYYDSNNEWVNAIDYSSYSYSENSSSRITTGWLDDYGDNSGTTDSKGTTIGRDIYNTDSIDYRRGIEVTTDIDVSEAYTAQSMSNSPEHFGDHLPSGATKTYHIAFANDANSGETGDSFHWLFKEEDVSSSYYDYCNGGNSRHQCSLEGYSNSNDYSFSSNRDYFKPQHCYGRTSIDRIYKKDTSGNIRVDKDGNKMIDKGFSSIDHLQGNYPKHWRRLIATYRQNQNWDTLTADTESMAKVTIYEKNSNSNEYKPSHRLVNGSYRVSSAVTATNYADIYFPDNTDGNETYYAYPFFHYLSPENCKFDDDDKKTTYHRDSAHTLTNYEGGGSGKTYAYNMSIGEPDYPMIQDYGQYYLTYSGANTYDGEYCFKDQHIRIINYFMEYTGGTKDNVVFKEDVENYINGWTSTEPTIYKDVALLYSTYDFTYVPSYSSELGTDDESFENVNNSESYTTTITDDNKPKTKGEWNERFRTTSWTFYGYNFIKSTRSDKRILKKYNKYATAPYQTIRFDYDSNTDKITAKITGELASKSTVNVNTEDKTVTVSIDYGTDFTGDAYTGNLVISDGYGHTLTYPIGENESITMAEARDIAAKGYAPMNDENNYWCRTDGQGDKGKEFVTY